MKKVTTVLLAGITLLLIRCNSSQKTIQRYPGRPNIIFLLADDMRYDAFGCTGNPAAITPHIDRLASEGTNFRNSYVTTAICCISRASYFTGQYERRHGIDDFAKTLSDSAFRYTYPALLRNSGYYTGFIGKYGIGNKMPSAAFDYWKGFAGHGVYFYKQPDGTMMHETALMGMQSREFMLNRDPSKPFCLSVSFKAPHGEDGVKENNGFRPDPYFNNVYTGTFFPFPATYADSFYLQFPLAFRKDQRGKENEARVRWMEKFSTREKYQVTVRAICRLVSGIDKVVGELRDFLRKQGLEKNTIIVLTSDNGYYLGEHGLEGKWYGHEESIRVPLIIYDPRLSKKISSCNDMVLNIDMASTILDWAGIPIPASMQGKSLLPLLKGPAQGWRREFFYEHRYEPGNYPVYIPHTVGIVTDRLKYMRYYNGQNSEKNIVHEELFDRLADRYEMFNLANGGKWRKKEEELKQKISDYEKKLQ